MKASFKLLLCVFIIAFYACKDGENNEVPDIETSVKNEFLNRVEPPHWWIGMKDNSLQLQIYHPEIGSFSPEINYPGLTIKEVHKAKSPNYLFVDLEISDGTKAGKFDLVFKDENDTEKTHTYELKDRVKSSDSYVG
ncbi:MAG: cyclomaltodextrinase N-terminal domain-containing protein, partial [Bacteroidia bacterium]|nr:cyclomaltodextrinase N-terminal domain-containing protein [Bacteroidia bacterium]